MKTAQKNFALRNKSKKISMTDENGKFRLNFEMPDGARVYTIVGRGTRLYQRASRIIERQRYLEDPLAPSQPDEIPPIGSLYRSHHEKAFSRLIEDRVAALESNTTRLSSRSPFEVSSTPTPGTPATRTTGDRVQSTTSSMQANILEVNLRRMIRDLTPTSEIRVGHDRDQLADIYMTGTELLSSLIPLVMHNQLLLDVETTDGRALYTLNERSVGGLKKALQHRFRRQYGQGVTPSDAEIVSVLVGSPIYTTIRKVGSGSRLLSGARRQRAGGAFFKHLLKVEDKLLSKTLERFGIYSSLEKHKLDSEESNENCLIQALRMGGMDDKNLTHLKLSCKNRRIPAYQLKIFAELSDIQITLKKLTGSSDDVNKKKYGPKNADKTFNLGLIDDHYFLIEDTPFTSFAIRHYEKVKHLPNWNLITKFRKSRGAVRDAKRTINSYRLIKLLIEHKDTFLKPIRFGKELCATAFYDKIKTIETLDYDDDYCTQEIGNATEIIQLEEEGKLDRLAQIYESTPQIVKRNLKDKSIIPKLDKLVDKSAQKKTEAFNRAVKKALPPAEGTPITEAEKQWLINRTYMLWIKNVKKMGQSKEQMDAWRVMSKTKLKKVLERPEISNHDRIYINDLMKPFEERLKLPIPLEQIRAMRREGLGEIIKKICKRFGNTHPNEITRFFSKYPEFNSDWLPKTETRVFCDFETIPTKQHLPFAACATTGKKTGTFIGSDCGLQLLKWVESQDIKKAMLIFHNARYDFRFLSKYLNITKYNPFGGFLSAEGTYNDVQVKIKCSYKIIPMALSSFSKVFGIKSIKEVMPYSYCTQTNIQKRWVSIREAKKHLHKRGEYGQFLKNIERWGLRKHDKFDLVEYAARYCEMDVEVLRQGYGKFREWILEFSIDIDKILTVPGFADKFLKAAGVYDRVFSLANTPRAFIQRHVVGGRVMVGNNERRHIKPIAVWRKSWSRSAMKALAGRLKHVEDIERIAPGNRVTASHVLKVAGKSDPVEIPKKMKNIRLANGDTVSCNPLADFDGVSLYPSAMVRLGKDLGGYLRGRPKVIQPDQMNMDFLSKVDGYFVEAKVTKVGKHREMPLLNYLDENGSRVYSNDMVGKTVYLDRVGMEDAIQFQAAEFELVRGYYYDEGRTPTIEQTMGFLFQERLNKKKTGNPIQVVYKLIMNSGYGRTLLKPVESTSRIYNTTSEMREQVSFNYESIKSAINISGTDKWVVKKWAPIDRHFNQVHIGVEVLSMSKRIMNEVLCTADDMGISIHYQDTDSMHVAEVELPRIIAEYKRRYGRDLVGKQLNQFHTDFDIHKPLMDVDNRRMGSSGTISCKTIQAVETICLWKKAYADHLVGISKKGKIVEDYHLRMKGIPSASIWYRLHTKPSKADIKEPPSFTDPMDLYRYLVSGLPVTFDLACGGKKASFDMKSDFTIHTRQEFCRRVSFKKGDLKIITV